jgi:hypothetical protein
MRPQQGRAVALGVLMLLLVGCQERQAPPPAMVVLRWNGAAPDPLSPQNDPPDRILVRWTPAAHVGVDELADRHCLAWDRHAEPVREEASGEARVVEFVCRPLLQR